MHLALWYTGFLVREGSGLSPRRKAFYCGCPGRGRVLMKCPTSLVPKPAVSRIQSGRFPVCPSSPETHSLVSAQKSLFCCDPMGAADSPANRSARKGPWGGSGVGALLVC